MADLSGDLYHAVDSGDISRLQQLIQHGADVNQYYDDLSHVNSKAILHFACAKGHTECIRMLLRNGALINAVDKFRMTSLMYAVCANNIDIVKILIEADSSTIDVQDSSGKAALHFAMEYGSEPIGYILLQNGGNPNIQNHQGFTPLMTLLWLRNNNETYVQLMNLLVSYRADVNIKSFRDNRDALHLAVITKKVTAVEYLLHNGTDINTIDSSGRTPLTNILKYHLRKPEVAEQPDDFMTMVDLLTKNGAELNMSQSESCNPLLLSVKSQCHQLVRYFLENGADVDIKLSYPELTPLIVAVMSSDIKSVQILLEYNCNLYTACLCRLQDQDLEMDPFELAAYKELVTLIKLFYTHGYNVSKWLSCGHSNYVRSLIKPCIMDSIREYAVETRCLTDLCVLSIFLALRSDIMNKLDLLFLPKRLKEDIRLKWFSQ